LLRRRSAARAEHADQQLDDGLFAGRGIDHVGRVLEKSTNSFSPVRCTWRIDGFTRRAQCR
jgi:hypothetical protein